MVEDARPARLVALEAEPLSVPLTEPFVIASGRVDHIRAALLRATIEVDGERHEGLGEAAALPPLTDEDQDDFLRYAPGAFATLSNGPCDLASVEATLAGWRPDLPATRAGVSMAIADALAKAQGIPGAQLLEARATLPATLETDITLSIAAPDAMVRRARFFWSIGFRSFKVKVGRDSIRDVECLAAVDVALPQAAFRLDANAGFDPASALALLDELARRGIEVELFEQPCGAHDVAGMAEVARAAGVPVIADESVRSVHDVDRLAEAGAAHGVNLKLAKHGGLLRAVAIGQRAQERGMRVMVGGMVETRLGMTAMAHVAVALGGVDYVDLDTAWLLEDDPFEGGYEADGPRYRVSTAPGLGVRRRGPAKVR